ncbi:MAG: hypothetical protein ACC707_03210 [Thiohalomonadales bacterium]
MKHSKKTSVLAILIMLALIVGENSFAQAQELVLVSATDNPVEPLSMLEIRRLYLGISITKQGMKLLPLRNYSDQILKQMLLQKVVFLSAKTYERQLLRRTFGTGSRRPKSYTNADELILALKRQPGAFTIMWRSKATSTPGLSIVQNLWISKD